jgi:hypothetical protein
MNREEHCHMCIRMGLYVQYMWKDLHCKISYTHKQYNNKNVLVYVFEIKLPTYFIEESG